MVPLLAELRTDVQTGELRGANRRTLQLDVQASSSADDATIARVHNLSEKGLLLETIAGLVVGDPIHIDLPHAGPTTAFVVWAEGNFFGCEFKVPVSKATVSAALLRSPADMAEPQAIVDHEPARFAFANPIAVVQTVPERMSVLEQVGLAASLTALAGIMVLILHSMLFHHIS